MGEPGGWQRFVRFRRSDIREDVDAELQFHLEMHEQDLLAQGHAPAAAREEAERRFGARLRARDACIAIDTRRRARVHRRETLTDMWQDLRFAFRTLRKSPGFTLVAVLCVGLGIGVTTTILSAVNAILIRPLPYPKGRELAMVYSTLPKQGERGINISYPDYLNWRDENRTFAGLGIWTWEELAFSGGGEPERVEAASVSASVIPSLGTRPILGRSFLPEDEQPGRARVVLLGYGLWRRRFGGDSSVVGRSVTVDGYPSEVIGVMPPGFAFPDRGQAWIPFVPEAWGHFRGNRGYAGALGRLKPGVTLAQAGDDLHLIALRLQREFNQDNYGWDTEVVPLHDVLAGNLRRPLLVFLGAVGFVLLIVCANVANLMLTRGAGRQREIAVRVALGAGRGRVIRQLVTESLLLAGLGGVVGLVLAAYGVRLFALAVPDGIPGYVTLTLDLTALLFAAALAAITGVLFGLMPAFRATDVDLTGALREGTGGSGEGRRKSRARGSLVVAEVALSLVLMIGAGLLLKSYRALAGTDLGFDPRNVLTFRVSLPPSKYDQPGKRAGFYGELFDRLRALPGVENVGAARGIPFSGWNVKSYMSIEGRPPRPQGQELDVHYQTIAGDYFAALKLPIVRGRSLTALDRDTANRVGVINETLARTEFAGEDPIGQRIKHGRPEEDTPWITIVGVVKDFHHYQLPQPMGPAIYYSYWQSPSSNQTLAVRTTESDPGALVPAVSAVLKQLDPDLPMYEVETLEHAVSRSFWRQRLQGQVIGLFAALAMVLAAIGIYGVISYAVAQRTRELGVRMALGASRSQVVGLVVGQGARLAVIGVAAGLAGALALTRVLSTLLYGVGAVDAATFIAVPVLLGAVALGASWLPARRAARIDPLVAMRSE